MNTPQDYNIEDEKGNTALVNALANGEVTWQLGYKLRELIKGGANLGNKKKEYGFALLKVCVQLGNYKLLKEVLEKDLADINARGEFQYGDRILHSISILDYIVIIAHESQKKNYIYERFYYQLYDVIPILFSYKNLGSDPIHHDLVDQYHSAGYQINCMLLGPHSFSKNDCMNIKVDLFLKIFIDQDTITCRVVDTILYELICSHADEFWPNTHRKNLIDEILKRNGGDVHTMCALKSNDSRRIDIFLRIAMREPSIGEYFNSSFIGNNHIFEIFESMCDVALTDGGKKPHPKAAEVYEVLSGQQNEIMKVIEDSYVKEKARNNITDKELDALLKSRDRIKVKLSNCVRIRMQALNSYLKDGPLIPVIADIIVKGYLGPSSEVSAPQNRGDLTSSNR